MNKVFKEFCSNGKRRNETIIGRIQGDRRGILLSFEVGV